MGGLLPSGPRFPFKRTLLNDDQVKDEILKLLAAEVRQ